jgi:hypothetical protein
MTNHIDCPDASADAPFVYCLVALKKKPPRMIRRWSENNVCQYPLILIVASLVVMRVAGKVS